MLIISLQYFQQNKKTNVLAVGGQVLAAGEVCGGRALCRNARDSLGKGTDSGCHSQLPPPGSTTAPPQATADPSSEVSGTSEKMYL